MILMLHILYQKHRLDLPKCLVENLMFFTSNISYILNAAANIFKGCGIFDFNFSFKHVASSFDCCKYVYVTNSKYLLLFLCL